LSRCSGYPALAALVNRITGTGSGCPGAAGIRQLAALVNRITGTGSGCPGTAALRQLVALVNRITGTGSGLSRCSRYPAAGRPGEPDHRYWLQLFTIKGEFFACRIYHIW
jgi:hypothetical protein